MENKALKYVNQLGYRMEGDSSGKYLYDAYLAGYLEATRWRDVEDELPEYDTRVLIRSIIANDDTLCIYTVDSLSSKTKEWEATFCFQTKVTHWRPIEPETRNP